MSDDIQILVGDCRERLRELPEKSVQTCVTSPPFFGLRDYGTGKWEGGDLRCDHLGAPHRTQAGFNERYFGREKTEGWNDKQGELREPFRDVCGKCGARRVDQQIGLEPTPDEFVAALVDVFRDVRRVLREDGTVWLNLGDSYTSGGRDYRVADSKGGASGAARAMTTRADIPSGMKPKDLIGIPWMVAFALRADGWYLRSDIIWSKPNPMPESVTDRPTKAHEYVFLLSKEPQYFYDADAIREDHADSNESRLIALREHGDGATGEWVPGAAQENDPHRSQLDHRGLPGVGTTFGKFNSQGRNKRSVWTVATQPYSGAHFAVFPSKLIEPCVLAGSSPKACGECGAPWRRVTKTEIDDSRPLARQNINEPEVTQAGHGSNARGSSTWGHYLKTETLGWKPSCAHHDDTGKSVVLDPFAGSGTTGAVALEHGRAFIGIELNPKYADLIRERLLGAALRLEGFGAA